MDSDKATTTMQPRLGGEQHNFVRGLLRRMRYEIDKDRFKMDDDLCSGLDRRDGNDDHGQ